jgi:hypothetical protein
MPGSRSPLIAALARWLGHPPAVEQVYPGAHFTVLWDGVPVGELDHLHYDQPAHIYRLTALTDDRSKLEYALNSTRREETYRLLLQDRDTGWLSPDAYFTTRLRAEGTLALRLFGPFCRAPREPLPGDQVAGFGSWTDAQQLVREAVEADTSGLST